MSRKSKFWRQAERLVAPVLRLPLNRAGWIDVEPAPTGCVQGVNIRGVLLARNNKQGIGVVRAHSKDFIVHLDWFIPDEVDDTVEHRKKSSGGRRKKHELDISEY